MTKTQDGKHSELATIRDTVESIGIAIILAFVLRAFMVEAFVIPTGSMAPRLMGEHWDLVCPNCGYEYAFGWPDSKVQPPRNDKKTPSSEREGIARCPNCFYTYPDQAYVNAGDRVLVMKYLYQFRPPQPWDVVVFRNPQSNRDNYIKRLIGLPGEEIQIVHGDVFVRDYKDPASQWRIRRKTPQAQEVMWQIICDNDYQAAMKDNVKKWQPAPGDNDKWNIPPDHFGREFRFNGGSTAGEITFNAPRQVFLPIYGYNGMGELPSSDALREEEIVTDLKLSATFVPQSADAVAVLHLSSFNKRFRASIGANGRVLVEHSDQLAGDSWSVWDGADVKIPPMVQGKAYELVLTNVDYRLSVLINGQAVYETTDKEYSVNLDELIKRIEGVATLPIPTPQVKFGARGGACEFYHVKLMRDEYYTAYSLRLEGLGSDPEFDFARATHVPAATWASMNHPIKLAQHDDEPDLDSFFMMGDNSPMSLDGRLWTKAAPGLRLWKHPEWNHAEMTIEENRADALYQLGTVPRYNMIGNALFVYWPSGFRAPSPMDGLPVIPNVGKMRLIR